MKIGIDIGHNVSCDGGAVEIRWEDELNRLVEMNGIENRNWIVVGQRIRVR